MCAIASIKKNTARTQTAGDHHSEEKYDQTRTKMTLTINQSNPVKRSCELDGIFWFTVSPPRSSLEMRTDIKDECKKYLYSTVDKNDESNEPYDELKCRLNIWKEHMCAVDYGNHAICHQ
jgi:hypothetical protein